MDFISLEEMLWHYVSRMNLAIENIEKQQKDLENLIMLLEQADQSKVGDAMKEKLEKSLEDTKDLKVHFEDALYLIRKQINELDEIGWML